MSGTVWIVAMNENEDRVKTLCTEKTFNVLKFLATDKSFSLLAVALVWIIVI